MGNADGLLMIILDCGSMDISILDEVGYDLEDIVEKLKAKGDKISLNAITDMIFLTGQSELTEAVEEAIRIRKEQQLEDNDSEEYDRLQEEIDELEYLNPEADMGWFCNCLDTSCWLGNNEDIYRKYIPEAISSIEYNMGFEF